MQKELTSFVLLYVSQYHSGDDMHLAILGTGYVGLVTGACFAEMGHSVVCVDIDSAKISQLKKGIIPFYEPGLEALVETNAAKGRLSFASQPREAIAAAEIVFIAVGTPPQAGAGDADLSFVYDAAKTIATHMRGFTIVVTKSTVPLGTGEEIEAILRKRRPDAEFAVVSNPEFLREGSAIADFKRPDRVVIGADHARARAMMSELYEPLRRELIPIVFTQRRTAELIKYATNAFLATKISFLGEIADLSERVGADVEEVARGMGLDRRIGMQFLRAGPGYGGSCFPKDTVALLSTAKSCGVPLKIVETVVGVNSARKRAMADRIIEACGGSVRGKAIALLGLSFKPNTDDMREAPSLAIVPALQKAGARLRAYDPAARSQARRWLPELKTVSDLQTCLDGADAAVIITEWDEFRELDLRRAKKLLRKPLIIDLRNMFEPSEMADRGISYFSIGRAATVERPVISSADALASPNAGKARHTNDNARPRTSNDRAFRKQASPDLLKSTN